MKTSPLKNWKTALGLAAGLTVAAFVPARAAGAYYGLWWDGSAEQFVRIDPYTAVKTVVKNIPGVQYLNLGSGYVFDPDRSRYAFVGRESDNQDYYYVIHAPTGDLVSKTPKTQNLGSLAYSPNERMVYGLSWADSSLPAYTDSLGHAHPSVLQGQEYFVAVDASTGAKTETPIPGVKYIATNSQFLDTDSGRYVFSGQEDGGAKYYYVIETATGGLLARIPLTISINNPVYNPALKAVHGLWWSDSSYYNSYDSLGRPQGVKVLKGMEYFVTLHSDSTLTSVALPDVKYIIAFNQAFDSDSGRYVFIGRGGTGGDSYYVLDAATGAVLSKTAKGENINQIAYAPASSTVDSFFTVAIARQAPGQTGFRVRSSDGWLAFEGAPFGKDASHGLSISLLEVSGRLARQKTVPGSGNARIDTRGMKTGLYLYEIRSGRSLLATGKVFIR